MMNGWIFCGNDIDVLRYQRKTDIFFKNFWSANEGNCHGTHTKKPLKISKKIAEKVSLKAVNNPSKKKLITASIDFKTKNQPQIQIQPKINIQIKLLQCRSQKNFASPRIQYLKYEPPKINLQATQAYCIKLPSPAMPILQPKPCNIKINYLSPAQNTQLNPQIVVSPQIQIPKSLKRFNTMPVKTQSLIFGPQTKDGQIKQLGLAKSMDYCQPMKNFNIKSTQNLHEIQCIKAQSIGDSQEMQDQYSIVMSPMDEDASLDKRDLVREIWGAYNFKESLEKQSLKETTTPQTAQQEIILHI